MDWLKQTSSNHIVLGVQMAICYPCRMEGVAYQVGGASAMAVFVSFDFVQVLLTLEMDRLGV